MAAEERVKKEETEVSLERENPNGDIERCSVSCTSSSSATISDSKWESDRMVKIELDAARALADFAQLALLERENPSGESRSSKWGHKGRRSNKRVKNETTAGDWGKNLECSKLKSSSSDLVQQECSVETQPWDKKVSRNVAVKSIKAEQDSELPTATRMCPRNYVPFSGGRTKQHLTEAEKEARRLRRVLANRESARQTIRRRQAMCEELTKKAAALALDNESMKREKELVMKEYQSLKNTNKQLKAQMAWTKAETEETPSTIAKALASSFETVPLHGYNRPPFTPFIWPSVAQPFSTVQTQTIAQKAARSQDPLVATGKLKPFLEHGNHSSANGPQTPYYMLPCPWFFPLPDHGNQRPPHSLDSCGLKDKQDDSFVGLSLKPMGSEESHQPFLCRKVKTEASSSTEPNSTDNFPESSTRLSTNGGGHSLSGHLDGLLLMPAPFSSVKPKITVKSESELPQASTSKTESGSTTCSHVSSSFPEIIQEASAYAGKKLVDAAAAAEARKRRKELTKLKNHHSRQLRLRC